MKPKLFRRKNGYWYVRLSETKSVSLKTRDKKQAEADFRDLKKKLDDKKIVALSRAKRIRLSEFEQEYIEGTEDLPRRTLDMAAGTIKNDKLAFKKFREFCGDLPLFLIRRNHIDDFKEKARAKGHSESYINILLRPLRAAFNAAIECGYMAENPFQKKNRRDKVLFNTGKKHPKALRLPELKKMLAVLDERTKKATAALIFEQDNYRMRVLEEQAASTRDFSIFLVFAFYSGLRRSELVRLSWPDIDIENGVIYVRFQSYANPTKDREERTVPLVRPLRAVMEGMEKKDIGPVFWRWRSPDTLSRLFHEVAAAAGIKDKTLHSTRHGFGVASVMKGVHTRSIQEAMGHSDISMTEKYMEIVKEELCADYEKFNDEGAL